LSKSTIKVIVMYFHSVVHMYSS